MEYFENDLFSVIYETIKKNYDELDITESINYDELFDRLKSLNKRYQINININKISDQINVCIRLLRSMDKINPTDTTNQINIISRKIADAVCDDELFDIKCIYKCKKCNSYECEEHC